MMTLREYAWRKGISVQRAQYWLKKGLLVGATKVVTRWGQKYWEIPEECLSVEPPRKGPKIVPATGAGSNAKIKISRDELKRLVNETNMTLQEIGEIAGVTRERVRQIINREDLIQHDSPMDRRLDINERIRDEQAREFTKESKRFRALIKVLEGVDLEAEPISPGEMRRLRGTRTAYGHGAFARVNGKVCRLYVTDALGKTSEESDRLYYRVGISKSAIGPAKFVIIITGEGRRVFVIPAKVLLNDIKIDGIRARMYYFPDEPREIYKNQYPHIDYWKYEEAWSLLGRKIQPAN